jgi:hypothetical protein
MAEAIIYLVSDSRQISSYQPVPRTRDLLGIAPGRVYLATYVAIGAGELLPHHFTPLFNESIKAGLFSVVLVLRPDYSSQRLQLGVTHPV